MPRYNLNHEDIQILSDALTNHMSHCSSTKQWDRMKKLKDRLTSKVEDIERSIVYDDPLWNHYQRKSS